MRQFFRHLSEKLLFLAGSEQGQDLVEYALVIAMVAFGAVASMRTLATAVGTVFSNVTTILSSAIA